MFAMFWLLLLLFIAPKIKYIWRNYRDRSNKNLNLIQKLLFVGIKEFSEFWNRHELHGLQNTYWNNNCLIVGYHSRCILDLVYVLSAVQPAIVVSFLFFKIPLLRLFLPLLNIMPSAETKDDRAHISFINALLKNEHQPLMLLPGGAFEFLKPYDLTGKIQWKTIPGFVRVIVQNKDNLGTKTRVVPFYTKNCEKLYISNKFWHNTLGKLSSSSYTLFKAGYLLVLPLMLTFMLLSTGFSVLPTTVKLDTYFGEPLTLRKNESAVRFSQRIADATQRLIDKVDNSFNESINADKISAKSGKMIEYVCYIVIGLYATVQNIMFLVLLLALIWLTLPILLCVQLFKSFHKCFAFISTRRKSN